MDKITQDSRRFEAEDLDIKKIEAKKTEVKYFVYPNYRKELVQHRIPVSQDMQDTELTNFMNRVADKENFEKRVSVVVRLRNVNKIEPNKGKRAEYMIWYEEWKGYDKNDNKLAGVSGLPQGVDKTSHFSRRIDAEGIEHFKQDEDFFYYTQPWDPEVLDRILAETNTQMDTVQYTVKGLRPWGGFNYDEFRNLSYEELCERGRTGEVNKPVIIEKKKSK